MSKSRIILTMSIPQTHASVLQQLIETYSCKGEKYIQHCIFVTNLGSYAKLCPTILNAEQIIRYNLIEGETIEATSTVEKEDDEEDEEEKYTEEDPLAKEKYHHLLYDDNDDELLAAAASDGGGLICSSVGSTFAGRSWRSRPVKVVGVHTTNAYFGGKSTGSGGKKTKFGFVYTNTNTSCVKRARTFSEWFGSEWGEILVSPIIPSLHLGCLVKIGMKKQWIQRVVSEDDVGSSSPPTPSPPPPSSSSVPENADTDNNVLMVIDLSDSPPPIEWDFIPKVYEIVNDYQYNSNLGMMTWTNFMDFFTSYMNHLDRMKSIIEYVLNYPPTEDGIPLLDTVLRISIITGVLQYKYHRPVYFHHFRDDFQLWFFNFIGKVYVRCRDGWFNSPVILSILGFLADVLSLIDHIPSNCRLMLEKIFECDKSQTFSLYCALEYNMNLFKGQLSNFFSKDNPLPVFIHTFEVRCLSTGFQKLLGLLESCFGVQYTKKRQFYTLKRSEWLYLFSYCNIIPLD